MNSAAILRLLDAHTPFDADEAAFLVQTRRFVEETPDFYSRLNPAGHLTGSAWVINEDASAVLLIHHAGLNRWLQPGGHVEDGDVSISATALREAREECGITGAVDFTESLYDLDIHPIPARKGFPAHLHYDFRFLVKISPGSALEAQAGEVHALKWVPLESVQAMQLGPSIGRMAAKQAASKPAF